MRGFLSFVIGILALILVVCGVIFVVENAATHSYSFLGATFSLPLWALVGLAALTGFLVALLVVTPERMAADAQRAQLRADVQRLERELADARAANEHLQSQLTTLKAEQAVAANERLQSQLTALQTEQAAAIRERDAFRAQLEALRAAPERTAGITQQELAGSAVAERRGANTTTPGQVEAVRETEQTTAPAQQPGLGGRMRTLFGKSATPAEGETPPGPAAPA